MTEETVEQESAFRFHGNWIEFLKIVLPNILLTLVTLGIYRFWATTRERQYLWSRTDFIDERLEWTGRGIELFIGFVLVFFLFIIPTILLQFGFQALILQRQFAAAILCLTIMVLLIFYLSGVAYFRALRYRLSRTYWRGIRGGSDDPGLNYGISYMWRHIVGALPIYLMLPWTLVSLWNERWNAMSFGPHTFQSNATWQPLMRRYLLFYLVPFLAIVGGIILGVQMDSSRGGQSNANAAMALGMAAYFIFLILAFYIVLPVAALLFYSKYYRNAVGALRLHKLEFAFKARSPDWLLFALANLVIWMIGAGVAFAPLSIALQTIVPQIEANPGMTPRFDSPAFIVGAILSGILAVVVLGLVNGLIRYRNWRFFIMNMEAYGEINIDELTQSATASPKQGEGLLDAFDVGAI